MKKAHSIVLLIVLLIALTSINVFASTDTMNELNNQISSEILDKVVSFIETTMSDFGEKINIKIT